MMTELVKPKHVQSFKGVYDLNCNEFKISVDKLHIGCCEKCHKNICTMWPVRCIESYSYLVCCTVGGICFKRKYTV